MGLDLLGQFDHEGYQGVFIGQKDQTWHLEFTQSSEPPVHTPDDDDLLIFYLGDTQSYYDCISRIEKSGIKSVPSKNPYWDKWGKTYLDPDNFGVVICRREWSNQ